MTDGIQKIISFFPVRFRNEMKQMNWEGIEEIRVRIGQPIELCYADRWEYLSLWQKRVQESDVREMLSYISRYSLYAYQEEVRQGYLTVEGGHRIGLLGQAVVTQGSVTGMNAICFFNVRIARERKGCATELLPFLWQDDIIYNTLFVSSPGAGKTTYLRDSIRMLSDGSETKKGLKVAVVDERSEIAACHMGIPQKDVGKRTDVLDHCPKAEGMRLLLRSMSPQVIAVDELGGEEDFLAVEQAACSGSRVLGTIHAADLEELKEKKYLKRWMERGIFKRFVVLAKKENGQRVFRIFDGELQRLC